jgi:hypothetical protein
MCQNSATRLCAEELHPLQPLPAASQVRLRANGNALGRGATVISPFVVGSLMVD